MQQQQGIIEALGALRAEIGLDTRLRTVETSLASLAATVTMGAKPPVWPTVMSSLVSAGALLVAFAALLLHR